MSSMRFWRKISIESETETSRWVVEWREPREVVADEKLVVRAAIHGQHYALGHAVEGLVKHQGKDGRVLHDQIHHIFRVAHGRKNARKL
eukprot:1386809-Amorphochlora_amoeboformis.AAC.1